MSKEQLKAFLVKVNGDTSLQKKLKAAKSSEDVVSIAKEHGHDFGTEHITQLNEEELEGVAGGIVKNLYAPFVDPAHYAKCLRITGITADDWLVDPVQMMIRDRNKKLKEDTTPSNLRLSQEFFCFHHPKKTVNQPSIPGTISGT